MPRELSFVFDDQTPAEQAEIRDGVLLAGVELLEQHGCVRGVPMLTHTRLAKLAHCGVASAYRYWPSKQELVHAVFTYAIDFRSGSFSDEIAAAVAAAVVRGDDLEGLVHAACAAATLSVDSYDVLVGCIVAEAPFLAEDHAVALQRRLLHSREQFMVLLDLLPVLYGIESTVPDACAEAAGMISSFARGFVTDQWAIERRVAVPAGDASFELLVRRLTTASTAVIERHYHHPSGAPIRTLRPSVDLPTG